MRENPQSDGSILRIVEFEIDRRIVHPSQLLHTRIGAAVFHSVVEWVIGIEVAYALEVQRLWDWLSNDERVFQICLRYTTLVGCRILLLGWFQYDLFLKALSAFEQENAHLENWLRLWCGRFNAWPDIDVDVIGGICHIGVHCGEVAKV